MHTTHDHMHVQCSTSVDNYSAIIIINSFICDACNHSNVYLSSYDGSANMGENTEASGKQLFECGVVH